MANKNTSDFGGDDAKGTRSRLRNVGEFEGGLHAARSPLKVLNHVEISSHHDAIARSLHVHHLSDTRLYSANERVLEDHREAVWCAAHGGSQLLPIHSLSNLDPLSSTRSEAALATDRAISRLRQNAQEFGYLIEPNDLRAMLRDYSAAAQLELHPSDICNEKCLGCTYGHDDPAIKPPAICFPISGLDAVALLRPKSIVIVGGGEPLLYRDRETGLRFPEFMDRLHQLLPACRFGLISNGTIFPDGEWYRHFDWVRFSVDAADATTYARVRGRNLFDRVSANLVKLLSLTTSQQINVGFVFSRENVNEMAKAALYFFELVDGLCPAALGRLCVEYRPLRKDLQNEGRDFPEAVTTLDIAHAEAEFRCMAAGRPRFAEFAPTNGGTPTAPSPLFEALFAKYRDMAKKLRTKIDDIERVFINDPNNSLKNLDPWKSADQIASFIPKASSQKLTACSTDAGSFLQAASIEKVIPNEVRNAEQLGLGTLQFCYEIAFTDIRQCAAGDAFPCNPGRFEATYKYAIKGTFNGSEVFNRFYKPSKCYLCCFDLSCSAFRDFPTGKALFAYLWDDSSNTGDSPYFYKSFAANSIEDPNNVAGRQQALSALRPKIFDSFRARQQDLYGRIASEFATTSPAKSAAQQMMGVKGLMNAYAALLLPRSMDENEYLRGLLAGDQGLLGDLDVATLYVKAKDNPIPDTTKKVDFLVTAEDRLSALQDATKASLTKVMQKETDQRFDMVSDVLEYLQLYKAGISGLSSCLYVVRQSVSQVPAGGGIFPVAFIDTDSTCPWQIVAAPTSWARWTGSGPGPTTISITFDPNPTAEPRPLTIQIADQPAITIIQAAGNGPACSFSINPTKQQMPAVGGNGKIDVTASSPICQWQIGPLPSGVSISSEVPVLPSSSSIAYTVAPTTSARILRFVVAGIVFTVEQSSPVIPGVGLVVKDASARPGQSVEVPIWHNGATAKTVAAQFDLVYQSPTLAFVSIRKGEQLSAAAKDITTSVSTGVVRVVIAGLNQTPISDGPIAYATFTLSPSMPLKSTTLVSAANVLFVNAQGQSIPAFGSQGVLTAAGCIYDLDGNGMASVADVQLLINQILGLSTDRTDLNNDQQITVADLQILINAVLGAGCAN